MNERLMIVDSDYNVRESLSNRLRKENFIVDCVATLKEALNNYTTYIHDFVITEIELPDGDGLEFVRKIKKLNPSAKIIVTTSYPSIASALKSLKLKVDDYIVKPFIYDEVMASLKQILRIQMEKEEIVKEKPQIKQSEKFISIIGESVEIKLLLEKIKKISKYSYQCCTSW